jgi:hypothetical protein
MTKDKNKADPGRGNTEESRRQKVVRLDEWKNRSCGAIKTPAPVAREKLCREEIPLLIRVEKEAFLLKFILSDETTDKELDELLLSATGPRT